MKNISRAQGTGSVVFGNMVYRKNDIGEEEYISISCNRPVSCNTIEPSPCVLTTIVSLLGIMKTFYNV